MNQTCLSFNFQFDIFETYIVNSKNVQYSLMDYKAYTCVHIYHSTKKQIEFKQISYPPYST